MAGSREYWAKVALRRLTRRAILRGGSIAAGTVAALPLMACSVRAKPGNSTNTQAGQPNASETPAQGGTFTTYAPQNPNSLDVVEQQYATTYPIASSVFSRLVRPKTGTDPQVSVSGEVESDLAASLESPDGLVWIAKLRPGARFQDIPPVSGRAVVAEDIKASVTKLLAPANNSRAFLDMIDAAQVETPAADTVVFRLKYAYGPFPKTVGGPGYIMPREGVSGGYDPTKTVIGSGPFLFQSYQPDIALAFKKNPNWFDAAGPHVDTVQSPVITDVAQQRAQFVAGKLDELNPSSADVDALKQQLPKVKDISLPDTPLWAIYGHLDRPGAYQDVRLRQAISIALDRETLGKAILSNSYADAPIMGAKYGKWTLPPDKFPDASRYLKFDLAMARRLVQESGAGEQLLKFGYVQNTYQQDAIAQAINPMLNAAGIKTQLVPLDYQKDYTNGGKGVFFGNYPADMIVLANLGGAPTPESFLSSTYAADSTRNPSKGSDDQVTDMIRKMLAILDNDARLKAVYEIQQYLLSKLYLIPVPALVSHRLVQPRLRNYCYAEVYSPGTGTWPKLWIGN